MTNQIKASWRLCPAQAGQHGQDAAELHKPDLRLVSHAAKTKLSTTACVGLILTM